MLRTEEKMTAKMRLLRLAQGFVIGAGAILPGVSGGVLCAAFGLYMPLMALVAHPKQELKERWRMWLLVGIGWLCGFLSFALLISVLLGVSEKIAMCVFAGLIVGTVPALLREANSRGKSRFSILALVLAFAIATAFFCTVAYFAFVHETGLNITPSPLWFGVCGAVLGISFVIPGMTSSTILMLLGLYKPMIDGVISMRVGVILPLAAGSVVTVMLLARLVNRLFTRFYAAAYHAVIGTVLSTTLVILLSAVWGCSLPRALLYIGVAFLGAALSFWLDRKLIS